MTVFVDASVLVAIVGAEPDADALEIALGNDPVRLTSGLAQWEAARAIARRSSSEISEGLAEVRRFCRGLAIATVVIDEAETAEAVIAQQRYGKGTGHPARLNMGDCFAYACARTNGARLLYKGDDFSHTDMAL